MSQAIPPATTRLTPDLERQVAEALRVLNDLAIAETYDLFRTSGGATLAKGLRAVLSLASASLGECRLAEPYAPLRPVLDADGTLRWRCRHDPEHCSS